MTERIEQILLQDSWSTADLEVLEQESKRDGALATIVQNWTTVSHFVRQSFQTELPDRRELVLFVLSSTEAAALLTPDEKDEVARIEPQIRSALDKFPSVVHIIDRIKDDVKSFDDSWSEALSPVRRPERAPLRPVRFASPAYRWGMSLAAAFAFLIAAIVVLRSGATSDEMMLFTADPGQTHIINLGDGSVVRLIDGSTLSYPLEETFDRKVTLDGKAFFDVQPGEQQFQVSTRNALTSVLGTRFAISSDESRNITEVVLVSGAVSLASLTDESEAVMLSPGQSSRVVGSEAPSAPHEVDLDQALSWTQLFIFRDTKLLDVAKRLTESFDRTIVVDEDIEDRTLTGTFASEQGLSEILEMIAAALDVQFLEDTDTGVFTLSN